MSLSCCLSDFLSLSFCLYQSPSVCLCFSSIHEPTLWTKKRGRRLQPRRSGIRTHMFSIPSGLRHTHSYYQTLCKHNMVFKDCGPHLMSTYDSYRNYPSSTDTFCSLYRSAHTSCAVTFFAAGFFRSEISQRNKSREICGRAISGHKGVPT